MPKRVLLKATRHRTGTTKAKEIPEAQFDFLTLAQASGTCTRAVRSHISDGRLPKLRNLDATKTILSENRTDLNTTHCYTIQDGRQVQKYKPWWWFQNQITKQLRPRPRESNVGCGTQWAGPIHNNFGLGEGGARHTNPKRFLNFGHQPRSDHIRCNVK